MTITPVGFTPFAGNVGDLTHVTPFTHRDNATFLTILKGIIDYINKTQVPHFNSELQRIIDELNDAIALNGAEWQNKFDEMIANITAEIGELNDAALAGLLEDTESSVYTALIQSRTGVFAGPAWGVVGDGVTNDAAALTLATAFADSMGVPLVLDETKTYAITDNFVLPKNLITNGAPFKKLNNNSTYALKTVDGFTCDWLKLIITGGASNDAGIWVTGDNVDIGAVTVTTLTADQPGANALFVGELLPANARSNIVIRNIDIAGFRSPMRVCNVSGSRFTNASISNFVTGLYIQDNVDTLYEKFEIKGLSASATGGAGQNGVLIEATVADQSVKNLTFRDCAVENASEHSYRIGGGFTCIDVTFERCISRKPGCINGVSTGGAAFKALALLGHEHKGLRYISCTAEDGNILGVGVNNFSAFNMGFIKGLTMTDCIVRKNVNATSAMIGLIIFACSNVDVTNPRFTDVQQQALKMVKDNTEVYPAPGLDNVQVRGGILDCATAGLVVTADPTTAPFKDIYLDTTISKGGGVAFRAETPTTVGEAVGSYAGCFAKFRYINSPIANAVATGNPPINSTVASWVHEYNGPVYGAFNSIAADGSLEINSVTGVRRMKKAGAWVTL